MSGERWRRMEEIFLRASELEPTRRRAFLDAQCDGDAELRGRIESMLVHDDDDIDVMATPISDAARAVFESTGRFESGTRIGPYRLEREIGRGGMGTVHLATRSDAEYRMQVAIKIMRRGVDDADLLRRFRAERQILASLDHPGIARMLDGGTTENAAPYVVMEYVEGKPIDEYCDDRKLSLTARLRLFRDVCSAVQFAHRNLVVHRDLKPANILVTADGTIRLLDFGIAKLLAPDSFSESVAVTGTEMRLLTPEYASPEQVKGEPITTAADVYALGVLLHRLLSGGMPYYLKTYTAGELERLICDQDPISPSASLPKSTSELESIASARSTEPKRFRRALAGELDLITLRALHKEPGRRYGSVEQLSEDILRYLEGRPIEARKDTWTYRTGKLVRRNPWGALAAGLILLLVLGSSFAFYLQARRIAGQRDRALAAEAAAQVEAETAGKVTDFLVKLFESSEPQQSRGREVPVREILDRGARRIRSELRQEHEVRARLTAAMAGAFGSLGHYEEAFPLADEVLEARRQQYGDDHPEYARALAQLGGLHTGTAEFEAAERELAEALEIRRRAFGPVHPDIVESLNMLGILRQRQGRYDESVELHRQALDMARQVDDDPLEVARCYNNLGLALSNTGEFEESERIQLEGLEIKKDLLEPDHPQIATSLNNISQLYYSMRRYREAEPYAREYLQLSEKLYGRDSTNYAVALSGLSQVLKDAGQPVEAEPLQRECLGIMERRLGEEHPLSLMALNNLANLRQDQGDLTEAEALHRRGLETQTRTRGRRNPATANSIANLANLLWDKGDFNEAEPLLREVLEIDRQTVGQEHPFVALDMNNLAVVLRDRDDPADAAEADELFRKSIELARAALGEDNGDVGVYTGEYGVFLARTGRPGEGERRIREAIRIADSAHGPEHFQRDNARNLLGEVYLARGELIDAERILLDTYGALEKKLGPNVGVARRARQRLVRLYQAWGRPDRALAYQTQTAGQASKD